MAISQARSKKSPTGSRYRDWRKKKQFELGRTATLTKVGEKKAKTIRTLGGSHKSLLLSNNTANVFNQKTKKSNKTKIITILENPANRNFVRRNIITKGCIIETELGKARVTSRPGQEETINAVLITEK